MTNHLGKIFLIAALALTAFGVLYLSMATVETHGHGGGGQQSQPQKQE